MQSGISIPVGLSFPICPLESSMLIGIKSPGGPWLKIHPLPLFALFFIWVSTSILGCGPSSPSISGHFPHLD